MKNKEKNPVDEVICGAARLVVENAYIPSEMQGKYEVKIEKNRIAIVEIKMPKAKINDKTEKIKK